MDGLPCREGCYCAAPICLLYVNKAMKLVPIAIQLKKIPGPKNPIFLPSDCWFDWVLAKIYFRSADAQVHYNSTCSISNTFCWIFVSASMDSNIQHAVMHIILLLHLVFKFSIDLYEVHIDNVLKVCKYSTNIGGQTLN